MNRRNFFQRVIGAMAATSSAQSAKPFGLAFHPNAFSMTMAPITRLDVLYGFKTTQPEAGGRVRFGGSFLDYVERERELLGN